MVDVLLLLTLQGASSSMGFGKPEALNLKKSGDGKERKIGF